MLLSPRGPSQVKSDERENDISRGPSASSVMLWISMSELSVGANRSVFSVFGIARMLHDPSCARIVTIATEGCLFSYSDSGNPMGNL